MSVELEQLKKRLTLYSIRELHRLSLGQLFTDRVGIPTENIGISHRKLRVTCNQAAVGEIKNIDAVKEIEKVVPHEPLNNMARPILAGPIPETVLANAFAGQGEVVAIADSGFDRGSIQDVHEAFTGRVKALIATGRPNPPLTNDPTGYGTHVAGSLVGDGNSNTMGGFIRGIAPKVKLVVQSLLNAQGGFAPHQISGTSSSSPTRPTMRVASNSLGPRYKTTQQESIARPFLLTAWSGTTQTISFSSALENFSVAYRPGQPSVRRWPSLMAEAPCWPETAWAGPGEQSSGLGGLATHAGRSSRPSLAQPDQSV